MRGIYSTALAASWPRPQLWSAASVLEDAFRAARSCRCDCQKYKTSPAQMQQSPQMLNDALDPINYQRVRELAA
jgi:hypothetical protein